MNERASSLLFSHAPPPFFFTSHSPLPAVLKPIPYNLKPGRSTTMFHDLVKAFHGSWITTVSDEGALSIPPNLRKRDGQYLGSVFITSTSGDCGRIYSMLTWLSIKEKLDKVTDAN